ncbi:MAG: hypothetical protein KGY76_09390 [Candidatus Thermoplasmatota archaeon]|nr:hypothetical protein [Candidatus Thermoplasmatota archaeon]
MAGRSATEMIWFAVSVIVTISLVGVFIGIAYNYSDTIQDNARGEAANYQVEAEIINDPAEVPYNETENNLTFYVKNTGKYRIDMSQIVIGLDGKPHNVNGSAVDILGNKTRWTAGTVAKINVSAPSFETGEDHYVWIEVQGLFEGDRMGSARDSFEFYL